MGFAIRPFEQCVEVFRGSRKGELSAQQGEHYDTQQAYAFENLEDWSDDPPVTSLYLQKDPFGYSERVLEDPKTLVEYSNFGGAVATWNANGSGQWCGSPGEWLMVAVELVQEQAEDDDFGYDAPGNYVDVIFAIWKVEEGYACAVWRPDERDLLASVMGLDSWPAEGWQAVDVWYGE